MVGGCSSDTLGLSNTLSEVIEAVAMAVPKPYEVISSEDLLSRIQSCNTEIERLRNLKAGLSGAKCSKSEIRPENGQEPVISKVEPSETKLTGTKCSNHEILSEVSGAECSKAGNTQDLSIDEPPTIDQQAEWDWRDEFILLGTDVTALFPSLSAENTAKSVRSQVEKSSVRWDNIDKKWLTLYIKLNEANISAEDLKDIDYLLPTRISKMGRKPTFTSYKIENKYRWPQNTDNITPKMLSKLMGLAMEHAVIFFFKNFTYTFGGKLFIQVGGGPIGARITMAVARLVMQDWKEKYNEILHNSDITELLSGLYVDDGRGVQRLLEVGERFVAGEKKFKVLVESKAYDLENNITRDEITRSEVLKAMNSINSDLNFTMELCKDFPQNDKNRWHFATYFCCFWL